MPDNSWILARLGSGNTQTPSRCFLSDHRREESVLCRQPNPNPSATLPLSLPRPLLLRGQRVAISSFGATALEWWTAQNVQHATESLFILRVALMYWCSERRCPGLSIWSIGFPSSYLLQRWCCSFSWWSPIWAPALVKGDVPLFRQHYSQRGSCGWLRIYALVSFVRLGWAWWSLWRSNARPINY